MRTYLNNDWQFFENWTEDIFRSENGVAVRIPHTNKEVPLNHIDDKTTQFVCGYKRNLQLQNTQGKTYLLTFDGVAQYAEVYVNGTLVGNHKCGYTAFTLDVTSFVNEGDNSIVVKVDSRYTLNQPPLGFVVDYMTYGGIYREVYLDEKVGTYVADVFVQAKPFNPVTLQYKLANFAKTTKVCVRVIDENEVVFANTFDAVTAEGTITFDANLQLWDVDNPKLYTLKVTVDDDVYQTKFGVREALFTKNGFYLNGKKVKIVGLNRHQSYPYVGYAMPESMQKLDVQIMKHKLGLNAVRTSHYPQSQHFIDECDRLGILVFTEIPGWQYIGDDEWKNIALNNVKEMVEQYRNHPSIVLWGVRINESPDCDELYQKTNALAHSLDSTRQTGGVRNFAKSHFFEDVYTYNDFTHTSNPSKKTAICSKKVPYLVTEYNGHMFPTKTYDDALHRLAHTLRYATMLDGVFAADTTCGSFGWCLFDYPTNKEFGGGDRVCYHGVLDMFRNEKLAAGVFSSYRKQPFLDVCFSKEIGDYPESIVGDMYVLTNADYIKVYESGKFIKQYTHKDSPFKHSAKPPILLDDMIGTRLIDEDGFTQKESDMIKACFVDLTNHGLNRLSLRTKLSILYIMKKHNFNRDNIVGLYNKYYSGWGTRGNEMIVEAYVGDKLVATKKVGNAVGYHLELTPSHVNLVEGNTYDVALVQIVAKDANGHVCPYLSKAITLRTEGELQIIGPSVVALQGGRTGCYVKTTGNAGTGTLYVDEVPVQFTITKQ